MTKQLIAVICALALAGAACGGSATTEDASPAANETTPTAGPAEARAEVSDEEWAVQVIEAWDLFQERYEKAAIAYVSEFETGPEQVALAVTLFGALAPAYEDLEASLPPSPPDAALDAAYAPFVDAVMTTSAAAVVTLASLEDNEEAYVTELEDGPEEGDPNAAYIVLRQDFTDIEMAVNAACFPVQAAMADEELPVLACTPDDSDDDRDDCSVDPLTEATLFERCFLPPGTYDLTVYGPAVSVTLPEPALISTGPGLIDVSDEAESMQFQVYATEALVDPSALDPDGIEATVPLPTDLTAWAEALPVTVEATGTSPLFGRDVPFVQVGVDIEAVMELGGDPILFVVPSDAYLGDVVLIEGDPATFWLVDHGSGFAVVTLFHQGSPAEERAWVESLLTDATLG